MTTPVVVPFGTELAALTIANCALGTAMMFITLTAVVRTFKYQLLFPPRR